MVRGLASSRSRARDLILRGQVVLAGQTLTKPGQLIAGDAPIVVAEGANAHVSRGAIKLAAALDEFGLPVKGRICLDVGASTGGFAQVLLERGAARVYAVDVGRGQLHAALAGNPRVVNLEGVDARALQSSLIGDRVDAIVVDVSFISLILTLPVVLGLAAPGAWLVALVKPQFELERKAIGKRGVVRTEAARERALAKVRDWLSEQRGWKAVGVAVSPITGAGGNQEFLLGAQLED